MKQAILVRSIALALLTGSTLSAHAQSDQDSDSAQRELDAVIVTASPLRDDSENVLAPVAVLAGAELDDQRAQSVGETVSRLPGVQSSYFGPAVGRPIIRGLDGARVSVLSSGLGSADVSTVSADHALTIEPFLADQIEVLKGPATLLYGSGAIGGVVNVVDGRVPQSVPEALSGRFETSFDTAANTRQGALRLDAGGNGIAVHGDVFYRRADDYEIPGFAPSDPEEAAESERGVVENTALQTEGGALGVSLIGDRGFLGVAFSTYRSNYGVPGEEHGHEHEEEEEEDHALGLSGPKQRRFSKSLEFSGVSLDIKQDRIELDSALDQPFSGAEKVRFKLARTDYEHQEIEPDGEVATDFENDETDARLELVHGSLGAFTGAVGLTWNDRDFSALGEEAFVPPSQSRNLGLFVVEQAQLDAWKVEFGMRYDRNRIEAQDGTARRFSLFSLSAAARYDLGNQWQIGLLADRAQRAPGGEELFADGPHLATGQFEVGDASLNRETANQLELELRYEGERTHLHASIYASRYDDFLFLNPLDEEEDELPVSQWTQQDASFRGIEVGARFDLAQTEAGAFSLDLLADKVRARLDEGVECCLPGRELPRIAPARIGAGLNWSQDSWRARLGAIHYFEPDADFEADAADNEYTLVDATVVWSLPWASADSELFLRGSNLTDEKARLQTSFLKDVAPLPGRNFTLGWRVNF